MMANQLLFPMMQVYLNDCLLVGDAPELIAEHVFLTSWLRGYRMENMILWL